MENKIILICRDFIKNKNILKKFNSLKDEFKDINFYLSSYQDSKDYDHIINILPSWIISINGIQDIVEGDVLILPLRKFIKNKIKGKDYVKEQ